MTRTLHPHAAAIDRIGLPRLRSHFNVKPSTLSQWKVRGVPPMLLGSVRTLAAIHGVQVPEIYAQENDL